MLQVSAITELALLPEQIIGTGVVAIATGANHSLFIKSDGSLWAMGWNQFGQLGDPIQTNSVGLRATNNFSVIISNLTNSGPDREFFVLQAQ